MFCCLEPFAKVGVRMPCRRRPSNEHDRIAVVQNINGKDPFHLTDPLISPSAVTILVTSLCLPTTGSVSLPVLNEAPL